jgi:hypothetical protein
MGRPACKGRIVALPGVHGSPFRYVLVSASNVRLNALLEVFCRTLVHLPTGIVGVCSRSIAIVRPSVAVMLERQFLQMVSRDQAG